MINNGTIDVGCGLGLWGTGTVNVTSALPGFNGGTFGGIGAGAGVKTPLGSYLTFARLDTLGERGGRVRGGGGGDGGGRVTTCSLGCCPGMAAAQQRGMRRWEARALHGDGPTMQHTHHSLTRSFAPSAPPWLPAGVPLAFCGLEVCAKAATTTPPPS